MGVWPEDAGLSSWRVSGLPPKLTSLTLHAHLLGEERKVRQQDIPPQALPTDCCPLVSLPTVILCDSYSLSVSLTGSLC